MGFGAEKIVISFVYVEFSMLSIGYDTRSAKFLNDFVELLQILPL